MNAYLLTLYVDNLPETQKRQPEIASHRVPRMRSFAAALPAASMSVPQFEFAAGRERQYSLTMSGGHEPE